MDEKLQNDEEIIENPEESEITEAEGAESAPEEPKKEEQTRLDKRINQKHRELMEERRRAEELQKRLDAIEQKQTEQRPEIPKIPDPYDDDYDEQVKRRDAAIAAAAAYDARQEQLAEQKRLASLQEQYRRNRDLDNMVTSYSDRAAKAGVKPEDLAEAGQFVAAYGVSDDLTRFILADEQGPSFTMFLARNPGHLDAIQGMSALQAVSYLESKVRPNLVNPRKNSEPAPEPAETLTGGGVTPRERGPKGATYE